jgi:hypothetical protein
VTVGKVEYMVLHVMAFKRAGAWYWGDGKRVAARGLRAMLRSIDAKLKTMEWAQIGDEIVEFIESFSDEETARAALLREAAKHPAHTFRLVAAADITSSA